MTVPQSLLVAALALAWLIVLVPMVSRRGKTVEETVEGRGFRVLQRSDSTSKRTRFGRRSVGTFEGEPSASGDESDGESSVLAEYPQTEAAKKWLAAQTRATTGDDDDMSAEHTDLDATTEIDIAEYDEQYSDTAELAPDERRTVETEYVAAEYSDNEYSEAESAGTEYAGTEYVEAEYAGTEYAGTEYAETEYAETEYADAKYGDAAFEQATPVSHENHRRQGRGGFDPVAAETARRFRYAKRQRVALVLLLLTILFGAAAVTLLPTLWIGAGVTGVLLIAYLTYLRRQVRIEEEVRQRRLARLQRARQIRPERYNEAAEYSHVPEYAAEAYPVSQVPGPAYDRRGRVVVDLEDDDPGFDDLDYYEPIVYKRASGQ